MNLAESKLIDFVKKYNKAIIIFAFFLCSVFCFWKCQYGYTSKDETLYLSTTYRIVQGDSLLFDEQHRTQLYAFLMYPLLKLYLGVFKTLDGSFLNFRIIYSIFNIITSLFIYSRLKIYSKIGSFISAIVFLLYSPYNIMALSYNSICLMTLTGSLILFLTYKNNFELFITGLIFSCAVLCNPVLAALYFIYSIIVFIKAIKKNNYKYDQFKLNNWLYITLGICLLAVIFVAFVFSRAGIKDIINSLQLILVDPEYPETSLLSQLLGYVKNIIVVPTTLTKYIWIFIILIFFLTFIDNAKKYSDVNFIFIIFITIFYIVDMFMARRSNNPYIIFPINVLGFYSYLTNKNKTTSRLFRLYFIPAFAYTLCCYLVSDVGATIICSSSIVCLMISIILTIIRFNAVNNESFKKITRYLLIAMFVVLLTIECYQKYRYVYRKMAIDNNSYLIKDGVDRGLYVDEENYDEYYFDIDLVKYIQENFEGSNVLYLTQDNIMYMLNSSYRNSGPSNWKTCFPYVIEMLNDYYDINPNKLPDIIYVDDEFLDSINSLEIINQYMENKIINNKIVYSIQK